MVEGSQAMRMRRAANAHECLFVAQSGLTDLARERPLTGVKRTRVGNVSLAAFDPQQTWTP